MKIEQSKLRAELYDLAHQLVADGFTVYYLPDPLPALTTWLIFGKADNTGKVNTGTASYDKLDGFTIGASIEPSRAYGSDVAFWFDRHSQGRNEYPTMLDACRAAARPYIQVRYIKNAPIVPNHGIKHFDWCADQLVNLTAD